MAARAAKSAERVAKSAERAARMAVITARRVRDIQGDVVQVLHKGKGRVIAEGIKVELVLTQVD